MLITELSEHTALALLRLADEIKAEGMPCFIIALVDESFPIPIEDLCSFLDELGIPYLGGIFPGIIYDQASHHGVCALECLPGSCSGKLYNFSQLQEEAPEAFVPPSCCKEKTPTLFCIADALSVSCPPMIEHLFNLNGDTVHYLGAGAGTSHYEPVACVFSSEGCRQDAMGFAFIHTPTQFGIGHGFSRTAGPFVATRTSGNVVHEINWRPAFEVYHEAIASVTDWHLTPENFFEATRGFPLGLAREGGLDVLRDPFQVQDDGSVVFVAPVGDQSIIYLLSASASSMITAADNAVKESDVPHIQGGCCFVVSCIARQHFLKKGFSRELELLKSSRGDIPYFGVLSCGEISSASDGYLELLNKTLVVSRIGGAA